jgi:hypothetical protein
VTPTSQHRLDGLEPDNLLAFLALVGLLRALEAADEIADPGQQLCARAAWDVDRPPVRARLFLAREIEASTVADRADVGIERLASSYEFDQRKDLNYARKECRSLLKAEVESAGLTNRARIDLLAALMSDAAIRKDDKKETIEPTPLCLLYGQGHQHFLDRLSTVPREPAPPPRGRGARAMRLSAPECLTEALFEAWHRNDPTFSFRWDPHEDVRYALMAGDPTDTEYQTGTQHGANRLAAIGIGALTLVPRIRGGRVRPSIIGCTADADGVRFSWPIWREPVTLAGIRALLAHPDLAIPGALAHLGVEYVLSARRLSVGKFMNFSRARVVASHVKSDAS